MSPFRRDGVYLVGLFLLSLLLRAGHLYLIRDAPLFNHLFLDPLYYDEWGLRITGGEWLGETLFFQDPLYPYFLGILYALLGHHYLAVVAIQAVLGSLVAPILFLSAKPWFGRPAALVGALLAATYLPSIYYEGLILKTWLGMFLLTAAFWALSVTIPSSDRRTWIGVGLLLGLACLARGNLLLFLPTLALWVLLDPSATSKDSEEPAGGARDPGKRRQRLAGRRPWAIVGCLLLGSGVVLGASAVRNRVAGGHWVLTTSNAGQNFFIGNNPFNTTGEYAPLPFVDSNPKHEERDFVREAERLAGRSLNPREVSRFWLGEALRWIRENPGDWLRLTGRKLRNYWGAYEIPDNLDYYLYRESSAVLRLPLPGFGLVAPLGLLGALLCLRRGGWPRALLLFVVVYSTSVVLFFVFSRFRMIMMPALFVFAGHAVMELARSFREARGKPGVRAPLVRRLALLVALFAVVNLPVRAPRHLWGYRVADRIGLPVRPETMATAHYNYGLAFAIRAKEAEEPEPLLRMAEAELRQALREDGSHAKMHVELGKVLARMKRNREAIEAYNEALRIEPHQWRTHFSLGLLYRREGDPPSAEGAFRQVVGLRPDYASAHVQLGEVLLDLGRREEAAEAFRNALRLAPDSTRAREGLASSR